MNAYSARKEKNLFYFTIKEADKEYCLDLNTGIFYGLRGKPISTLPSANTLHRIKENYASNVTTYLYYCKSRYFPITLRHLKVADTLDNLNIRAGFYEIRIIDKVENIKYFLNYREDDKGLHNFSQYLSVMLFNKKYPQYASIVPDIDKPTLMDRTTDDNIKFYVYYLYTARLSEFMRDYEALPKIEKYLAWCETMEKTPTTTANFIREYAETKKAYNAFKEVYDLKRFENNYAKHKASFEFSYGDYTVVIPPCPTDLVREGNEMHHCVGGYVNDIIEGNTYIVYIRNKNDLTTPHITCQVRTNGELGQYYLAYDRDISEPDDIAFKKAFKEHLANTWN